MPLEYARFFDFHLYQPADRALGLSEAELEATHRDTRELREHAMRNKVSVSCDEMLKLNEESASNPASFP